MGWKETSVNEQVGKDGGQAGDISAHRTQNIRALHVGAAAGGGRSSAISRRISANKCREMATSAGNTDLHGARTEGGNHAE
jgi:hypothetical protein